MRTAKRQHAGYALAGGHVCDDCDREVGIALPGFCADVYHDGHRRECVRCGDIFTGPVTGEDLGYGD